MGHWPRFDGPSTIQVLFYLIYEAMFEWINSLKALCLYHQ